MAMPFIVCNSDLPCHNRLCPRQNCSVWFLVSHEAAGEQLVAFCKAVPLFDAYLGRITSWKRHITALSSTLQLVLDLYCLKQGQTQKPETNTFIIIGCCRSEK